MLATIRYILLTALRDKLFVALMAAVVLAALISGALAGTSMIEEQQMALSFSAATARLVLVVGLIVFTVFNIRYAFDNKEIDVMISRPISRPQLIFAYWFGFAFISTLMACSAIAVIAFIEPMNMVGFVHWSVSLVLELWVISALSLVFGFIIKSAVVNVISVLSFYIFARMIGFFIVTVESRHLFKTQWMNDLAKNFIEKIAYILPRFDFFAKTEWLIYGNGLTLHDILLYGGQTLVFIPLVLLVGIFDFNRKQF